MAIKNKTKYAILGILSISPGTGYDIKKYCDTIISNFWHENYGHIYPVLSKLEKDGLIKTKQEITSTRKKEYFITDEGKEEFIKWLLMPVEYQPVRSEFFLKLTFSCNLPKDNVIAFIRDYKERHEKQLLTLKDNEAYLNTSKDSHIAPERKFYLYAPLRYGILSAEAAIAWCEEMLSILTG